MKRPMRDIIVDVIGRRGPITPKGIAREAMCHVSTVRRHLKVLRDEGLVGREVHWLSQFAHTWLYFLKE